MPDIRLELSAIVYQEDGWWIAHCLQMDIAAEGKTTQEALVSLFGLVDCQIDDAVKSGNVDSLFQPAPPELWRLFSLGKDHRKTPTRKRGINRINRFAVREMAFA